MPQKCSTKYEEWSDVFKVFDFISLGESDTLGWLKTHGSVREPAANQQHGAFEKNSAAALKEFGTLNKPGALKKHNLGKNSEFISWKCLALF